MLGPPVNAGVRRHEAMETAEFAYSKWEARLGLVSIPIVGLLALGVLASGLFAVVHPQDIFQRVSGAPIAALGLWMMVFLCQWVRYRHVLTCRYIVDGDGIREESNGESRRTPWAAFAAADYFPLLFLLLLRPMARSRPVVLFLTRRSLYDAASDARNKLARQLVATGMHGKYRKRWIT